MRSNSLCAADHKPDNGLAQLIALCNFLGVVWMFWATPGIAFFVATLIAAISLKLKQNFWAWLLSLAASFAIACFFIMNPPTLPPRPPGHYRAVTEIKGDLRHAETACERFGRSDDCGWRQRLVHELYNATHAWEPPKLAFTYEQEAALYVLSFTGLLVLHKLAAGQNDTALPSLPPLPIAPIFPTEDPEADKLKQRDFDAWIALGGVIRHETSEPSMRLQDVYARYTKWIKDQPGASSFDLDAFQKALKVATNKELIKVGSETVVPGISFSNTSLI